MTLKRPAITPGPWKSNKIEGKPSINIRAGEQSIANVYAHVGSPALMDQHEQGAANAAVITQTPALLSIVELVAGRGEHHEDTPCQCSQCILTREARRVLLAAGYTEEK